MFCFMVQIACKVLMQILRMRHRFIVPADIGVQMEPAHRDR